MILPALTVRKRQRSPSLRSQQPHKIACVAEFGCDDTSLQTSSVSTSTRARGSLIGSRRVQYQYARLRAYIKSKSRGGSNAQHTSGTDDSTGASSSCVLDLRNPSLDHNDTTSRWSMRPKLHRIKGVPWSRHVSVPEYLARPNYDGSATLLPNDQGRHVKKRLSVALLNPLSSSPTVKVKREKRARPSVQSLSRSWDSHEGLSLHPDSGATTARADSSTPATSDDSPTGSPGSIRRHVVSSTFTVEQMLVLFNQQREAKRLSVMEEGWKQVPPTIRTVEATAAAKYGFMLVCM